MTKTKLAWVLVWQVCQMGSSSSGAWRGDKCVAIAE